MSLSLTNFKTMVPQQTLVQLESKRAQQVHGHFLVLVDGLCTEVRRERGHAWRHWECLPKGAPRSGQRRGQRALHPSHPTSPPSGSDRVTPTTSTEATETTEGTSGRKKGMEGIGDEQWEAEWMRLHSETLKSQGPQHILQSSAEKIQLHLEN